MNFEELLKNEQIRKVMTHRGIEVTEESSFGEVVAQLQKEEKFCAVILEDKKVVGIFTELDALKRGLVQKKPPETPIAELMTPQPTTIGVNDNLAQAMRQMHEGKYRHLPVVNAQNEFIGLISVRDIVYYLSENYPLDVFNQPPDHHKVSAAPEGA